MAVSAAASMPPVSDSATATVSRRATSSSMASRDRAPAVFPGSPPLGPFTASAGRPGTRRVVSRSPSDALEAPPSLLARSSLVSPGGAAPFGSARHRPAQPHRARHIVGPGHHRDDERGPHHHLPDDPERPGEYVQRDRDHLQHGLDLPAAAGGDDPARDDPEAQAGDGQLTEEDHPRYPPRQLAQGR